ncbi:hypothetical protein [Rahnella woolbedingensis]|uniref:Uncharacterized protein n=1 Tax=Rahnella woolbedingensis TaxID=1510574 RepID=A0A419NCS7_9GAMM|nr:hypothetical protein [Rahnella woolbedingensis]RJT46150.1 hypothetical protein D6C13_05630 [Rahnella woolbedingensis]
MTEQSVSVSAQALLIALLTRQISAWQTLFCPPRGKEHVCPKISATFYNKILEPMWWCCRGPKPVTMLEKDSIYWLCVLAQEPTPVAFELWILSVKFRYQKLTGNLLTAEAEKFLLICFMDFAAINKMYISQGHENWKS